MSKKQKLPYLLALLLATSGCELISPQQRDKLSLGAIGESEDVEQPEIIYQELSNLDNQKKAGEQAQIELYPGTGRFVSSKPLAGKAAAKPEKGEYSLNFDDAALGEVTKVILSDILGENYLLSPKVTGKVTLQTTRPLSRAELLPTLEMLLQINNAALTYQEGLYQIKPAAEILLSSPFAGYGAGGNCRREISLGWCRSKMSLSRI
nr:hypothetical protein [Methylomarinum sp. Ch1-1]MDP4522965.1 hypothetical protein [Methylomarinum sp. Ch1-1]